MRCSAPTRDRGRAALNLSDPYTAAKAPNYNPKALDLGYKEDDPYAAPRDPRMEACIIRNGDQILWGGELRTVETFVGGENGISDDTSENRFTRTGYYYRKYIAPDVDATDNKADAAPWKFFRLAEIKLNLAEAAAEAGELGVAKGAGGCHPQPRGHAGPAGEPVAGGDDPARKA